MGKYNVKFNSNLQGAELQNVRNGMLCDIANELAEANRLKRLELSFLQVTSELTPRTIDDIFDHGRELKDQT